MPKTFLYTFSLLLYTGPVFDIGLYAFGEAEGEKNDNMYGKDANPDEKWMGFNCLWGVGFIVPTEEKCIRINEIIR